MPSGRRFKKGIGMPYRKIGDDIVWLNPLASRLFSGNSTAAVIYESACAGKGENEIVASILETFEGDSGLIKQETEEFLNLLLEEKILEEVE